MDRVKSMNAMLGPTVHDGRVVARGESVSS